MASDKSSLYFNKHIIAALIVTPILAIIAWLGIDYSLREKPHAAAAGTAYELLPLPNCRYQSGRCSMKNGDVEVDLEMAQPQGGPRVITLQSSLPLDGVQIALVNDASAASDAGTPTAMQHSNPERTRWQMQAPPNTSGQSRLRVAIAANKALYFAEVPTAFSEYQTPFKRDFRRNTADPETPPTNANTL